MASSEEEYQPPGTRRRRGRNLSSGQLRSTRRGSRRSTRAACDDVPAEHGGPALDDLHTGDEDPRIAAINQGIRVMEAVANTNSSSVPSLVPSPPRAGSTSGSSLIIPSSYYPGVPRRSFCAVPSSDSLLQGRKGVSRLAFPPIRGNSPSRDVATSPRSGIEGPRSQEPLRIVDKSAQGGQIVVQGVTDHALVAVTQRAGAYPAAYSAGSCWALIVGYCHDVAARLAALEEKLPWLWKATLPVTWACRVVRAVAAGGMRLMVVLLKLIPWNGWILISTAVVVAFSGLALGVVTLYIATGVGRSIETSDRMMVKGGLRMLGGFTGYRPSSWTQYTDHKVCPWLPLEGRIPWTRITVCQTPAALPFDLPATLAHSLEYYFREDNKEWLLILEKEKVAIATIKGVSAAKTKWTAVARVLSQRQRTRPGLESDSSLTMIATFLGRLEAALAHELGHLYEIPTQQGLVLSKTRSTIRRSDEKSREHEKSPLSKKAAKAFHTQYAYELENIGRDLEKLIRSLGLAIGFHEEAAWIIAPLSEEAQSWVQACDRRGWGFGWCACDRILYRTMQELDRIEKQADHKLKSIHHSAKLSLERLTALLKEVSEEPGRLENIPFHTESLMTIFSFHTNKISAEQEDAGLEAGKGW
ncbi:carbohydrate kinase FGGY [Marssonina coronariae]|uniref:Carbohydrate kinase FGGY n=1 Tax=Diplocarpon coronariae TaxID=2795749 RepID=A0A218Z810_9HELO|nr:hypothetical protein JHW43_008835 [Diplocarpon mali]OWP04211.1 carbohydrate kinase FGGY [Marssonina coronariae]